VLLAVKDQASANPEADLNLRSSREEQPPNHSWSHNAYTLKVMAESPVPEVWSFPTNPDDFGEDDRISFSRLDNKYVAVQEDGTEYEFDADLKRWIPLIDEALIEQQRSGYGGLDSREEAAVDGRNQGKKRKKDEREVSCD
jgi:hypothetical protein